MPTPPRRRWYQFSLRTLFVGMTLACVALGGFGWWAERSREWIRQRREWRGNNPLPDTVGERVLPAPGGLWIVGEYGNAVVGCPPDKEKEARQLFPEATLIIPRR